MNKKEAFGIVFNELCKNGLLMGNYDAKNGNEHFMNGIGTVMEAIAANIDDETYENFSDTFIKNLVKSEEKALTDNR